MKEIDLKRAYNNVMGQAISESRKYLFVGNRFGDIFVQDLKELDKSGENPPAGMKLFPQGAAVDINCLSFHRNFLIVGTIGLIYGLKWNEESKELSKERSWEIKIPMHIDAVEVPDVNFLWLQPAENKLYAACGDSNIYQICLESGRIVREYSGHTDYIHAVVGNADGNLYTASEDGTVRFWCDEQKQSTALIEPYKNPDLMRPDWGKWIGAVAANDDWLICGGGPKASIWYLRSMQCSRDFPFPGKVHICDFVEECVLVAGEYNHAQFYALNGDLQANIPMNQTASYSAVWQLEPTKFMSIAGFSNKLHILKDFRFLDSKIEMYGNVQE